MKVCVYGSSGLVGQVLIKELAKLNDIEIIAPMHNMVLDADLYFLCTPESISKQMFYSLPIEAKIIDFSHAHRCEAFKTNTDWSYGQVADPNLKLTNKISVAGCIASSIELALLPLINIYNDIFITSFIGRTAQPGRTINSSTEIKHVFEHEHNYEINKFLGKKDLTFVPVIGEHKSGIMTVCQFSSNYKNIFQHYQKFYTDSYEIKILNKPHKLSDVVGTNNTIISIIQSKRYTSITCSIDNLYRGAATHGIQLMQKLLK